MIAALLLALQLSGAVTPPAGAAATADPVSVRTGEVSTLLPVHVAGGGAGVRADALASALGGALRLSAYRYTLSLPGTAIDLEPGLPLARVGDALVPLAGAPWMDGAALFVPLQLLTEIIPRFATGFFYDVAAREVRLFAPVAAVAPPASARAQPPATADRTRVTATPAEARPRAAARRIVVVDAGHGGHDPGASGPMGGRARRIYEKDVNLAVAKLVADELRALGVTVVMTRTTDTFIALSDRGRIANRARGDLFISIHANAAPTTWSNPSAGRGFETYFLSEAKTEEARRVEQMENEAVRFETGAHAPRGDPLSFIINDMAQNEHLREAMDLAESIQQSMRRVHPGPNRGVKQANFAVLRGSFMPAVLVELGFVTNPAEAAYISSAQGQRELAAAIARGAVEYLAIYEQRLAGAGAGGGGR